MDKDGLAAFLRSRRERIDPGDVGLPRGPRRRTPGLRREEVAQLAHISTDHYTRLEQARGRHPSPGVLQAIAGALRLTELERAHLFALAGEADRDAGRLPAREVSPSAETLLHRLRDTPALVLDGTCQVLAWNPPAGALFEDFVALGAGDRNVLRRYFLSPGSYRARDHRRFVGTAVGYLRLAATRYPADDGLRALIGELRAASGDFRTAWDAHEMRIDHHAREVVRHPRLGEIELDFDVLTMPDRDQQVLLFTAEPGTESERALRLLAAPA